MWSKIVAAVSVSAPLTIGPQFGWVTLVAATMAIQVVAEGMPIMKLRKELKVDYPDMGNGRSAAKLNDKDWERFNNAMRAHYNYVEGIGSALAVLLISGAFYPLFSAALGAVYVLGRRLYSSGYRAKGAEGRGVGAIVLDIALVGLWIGSVVGSLSFAGVF